MYGNIEITTKNGEFYRQEYLANPNDVMQLITKKIKSTSSLTIEDKEIISQKYNESNNHNFDDILVLDAKGGITYSDYQIGKV